MNVNPINPSFNGYIQATVLRNERYDSLITLNTNNVTFDNHGRIFIGDRTFQTKHTYDELQKAVLKADANPKRIIDVEKSTSKFDYKI